MTGKGVEDEDYERFEQDFMNEARRLAEFSHLPFIVSIYTQRLIEMLP